MLRGGMAADLDPLELHLLEQLGPLEAGPAAETPGARGDLAGAGREPPLRLRRPLPPEDGPQLLHDRLGGAREQRLRRARAPPHRPGAPPLPLRRASTSRAPRRPGATACPTSCAASPRRATEPIAGGRHKVFGHAELAIIPQTSTIASHLPRAFGVAFAIERAKKLGVDCPWPSDGVVVCSFGDASLNHATAQAALNSAAHTVHQGLPLPLLFLCEDNGLGISVPSPQGWVEQALRSRTQLRYAFADGTEPEEVLATARELVDWIREHRRPAVLHLRTVRFLSHAGADVESAYRTPQADPRRLGPRPAARDRAQARGDAPVGAASGSSATTPTPASASARPPTRRRAYRSSIRAAEIVEPLAPRAARRRGRAAGRGRTASR